MSRVGGEERERQREGENDTKSVYESNQQGKQDDVSSRSTSQVHNYAECLFILDFLHNVLSYVGG